MKRVFDLYRGFPYSRSPHRELMHDRRPRQHLPSPARRPETHATDLPPQPYRHPPFHSSDGYATALRVESPWFYARRPPSSSSDAELSSPLHRREGRQSHTHSSCLQPSAKRKNPLHRTLQDAPAATQAHGESSTSSASPPLLSPSPATQCFRLSSPSIHRAGVSEPCSQQVADYPDPQGSNPKAPCPDKDREHQAQYASSTSAPTSSPARLLSPCQQTVPALSQTARTQASFRRRDVAHLQILYCWLPMSSAAWPLAPPSTYMLARDLPAAATPQSAFGSTNTPYSC